MVFSLTVLGIDGYKPFKPKVEGLSLVVIEISRFVTKIVGVCAPVKRKDKLLDVLVGATVKRLT